MDKNELDHLTVDQQFFDGMKRLLDEGYALKNGLCFIVQKKEIKEEKLRENIKRFELRVKAYGDAISKAENKGDTGIFNEDNLEKYRQLMAISALLKEEKNV